MKSWHTRLSALESRLDMTRPEAEDILALITDAVRLHVSHEQYLTLQGAYERLLSSAFHHHVLLLQPQIEAWVDRLIDVTKLHCRVEQRRLIVETLQHQQLT